MMIMAAGIFLVLFIVSILYSVPILSSSFNSQNQAFAQTPSNNLDNLSMNDTDANNTSHQLIFLGTEEGQITGQRVLEVQPFPKVEISFKANSTFEGMNATDIGTFWAVMKPDGSHYGEGQGIHITESGEVATWTGQGIGNMTSDEKTIFHGSLFHTADPQGELGFLNNKVGYFHFEIDKQGKTSAMVWMIS